MAAVSTGVATLRRRHQEEGAEAGHDGGRTDPLLPAQVVPEPDAEDEQQEQQLGGEHRLDDAQLAEAERGGLQPEHDQHQPEADQPDAPFEGVGHQAPAHGRRLGGGLDADPLQHRGQCVDEGCTCRQ
jgi:hypothetical protein